MDKSVYPLLISYYVTSRQKRIIWVLVAYEVCVILESGDCVLPEPLTLVYQPFQ
jgi:hypothetical protein